DQRDHDDHRERDAVAAKLDELLDQHRRGAAPEPVGLRPAGPVHRKLSCALARRSMNTSSSEACACVKTRPDRSRYGAIAASRAAASRRDTCRLAPNGATMAIPGRAASSSASLVRLPPFVLLTVYVVRCEDAITSSTVPRASSSP